MGKVKQMYQDMMEAKFKSKESEFELNDAERAQYEAEFNAWLDAYEQSFAEYVKDSGRGKL